MAIKKLIVTKEGIQKEYHKISGVNISSLAAAGDTDNFNMSIVISSYVTENYRNEDVNNVVGNGSYTFEVPIETLDKKPIMFVAYAALKTLPEFEGAEDC